MSSAAEHIDAAHQDFVERLSTILQPRDLRKFRIPHGVDNAYYEQILEHLGTEFFLNTIAAGQLPAEIALEINVPLLILNDWMFKAVDVDKVNLAKKACAESMMVKSAAVLLIEQETSQQVALCKEWSKRLQYMAERLDNDAWGPPIRESDNSPSTVHIAIGMQQSQHLVDEMGQMQDIANKFGGQMTFEDVLALEIVNDNGHDAHNSVQPDTDGSPLS